VLGKNKPLTKRYPCSPRAGERRIKATVAFPDPRVRECAMGKLATIDVALDEMLVNLAAIVLRLSKPELTRTPEARNALAQSVHQYAVCAARSTDPRVHELKSQLEETLKPSLRVVARDGVKVS
jgi:hypothetical protein